MRQPFRIPPPEPGKIGPKGGMDMMIGTVLGSVELLRAMPGAAEKRFVRVQSGGMLLTAMDPVGVDAGETVLLAVGEGANRLCPEVPVDAAILGAVGNKG